MDSWDDLYKSLSSSSTSNDSTSSAKPSKKKPKRYHVKRGPFDEPYGYDDLVNPEDGSDYSENRLPQVDSAEEVSSDAKQPDSDSDELDEEEAQEERDYEECRREAPTIFRQWTEAVDTPGEVASDEDTPTAVEKTEPVEPPAADDTDGSASS